LDGVGKNFIRQLVIEEVGDVRQIGLFGIQTFYDFQTLIDRKMRWMWFFAKGINDEHIESFEKRPTRIGDFADIGTVRDVADPESKNRQATMMQANWLDGGPK